MANHPNEDLFENTTMTFGEHLEELRLCLTRALIGLVLGFLIGLLMASKVVIWLQGPIERALTEHFSAASQQQLAEQYSGQVPPGLERFVSDNQLLVEEVFFERRELSRLLDATVEELDGPAGPASLGAAETARPDSPMRIDGQLPEMNSPSDRVQMSLLAEPLPAPSFDLVKTRIWRAAKARLTTLSPHEGFIIWLKAGFATGMVLASPYIFYQVWVFVAAGLYPHEKSYVHIFLPVSIVLFISGAATAFFLVFGPVLRFLFSFTRAMNIAPDLRISEVVSFVLFLPLGFGLAFQLPLVMLFLNRIGVLSVAAYLEKWRVAILVIFVISMLLTPADPISMLLMAGPLTALYFLGIGLCKWMPRGRNPFVDAYEP